MATKAHDVSITPSALPASAGTWLSVQNIADVTVHLAVAASPPGVSAEERRVIVPGASYEAKANSGEAIYVWTPYGIGLVSYEETA